MPEWSNGAVSKTVVPLRVPRVRIPIFPQKKELQVARLAALFAWKAADEKVSAAKLG